MTTPTSTIRKLEPGTLTVGSPGAPLDFSGQATTVAITWDVDNEDDVPVLSGATISGDRTYTATLEVTVYQDDLVEGGQVDYSWAHKGQEVPFTFEPYNGGRGVTGTLVVDPLDIGGDVGKKNTSDLKWACVGEPTLVANL